MGGVESTFAFELLDRGKFYVPIPGKVYYPLRMWAARPRGPEKRRKKRKHTSSKVEDSLVPGFVEFVNSPSRINSVYEYGSENSVTFVDSVFHFFYQFGVFDTYWKDVCASGKIFSKQCRMMYVGEKVITSNFWGNHREYYDTKFVESALYSALTHNISCVVPLFISLLDGDGDEHANMGFLKYDSDTTTVTCTIFEPHALKEDVDPTISSVREFLEGIIAATKTTPTLNVVSPWHDKGLQGGSPICVQWSLLMFFTFMLNCEVGGGCNMALEKELLMHVWKFRSAIMPIWMYYMDTNVVRSKFTPGQYIDPEFDRDTEIDVYTCHTQKAPCSYPCAPGKGDGCYNSLMFREEPQE